MLTVIALSLAAAFSPPHGAVMDGHERRGAVIARLDGAASESWRACAAACAVNHACQAWTWRTTGSERCALHSAPRNAVPHPGAVTGLSASLASRIEAAADRPLSDAELAALRSTIQPRGAVTSLPAPARADRRAAESIRTDALAGGPR